MISKTGELVVSGSAARPIWHAWSPAGPWHCCMGALRSPAGTPSSSRPCPTMPGSGCSRLAAAFGAHTVTLVLQASSGQAGTPNFCLCRNAPTRGTQPTSAENIYLVCNETKPNGSTCWRQHVSLHAVSAAWWQRRFLQLPSLWLKSWVLQPTRMLIDVRYDSCLEIQP